MKFHPVWRLFTGNDVDESTFFAQSREAAGRDDYFLEVEKPVTESEFWALLTTALPALAPYQKTARLARRETYLQKGEWLHPKDEIAVIPPVSGG